VNNGGAENVAREALLPQLQKSLQALVGFFGPQVHRVVPETIDQVPAADRAIWIAEKLTQIQNCRGFALHLREYLNAVTPSLFVSCLAAYLIESAEEIELEPSIPAQASKPDLRVQCKDQAVFIECKCPLEDMASRYLDEHQGMFDALRSYVSYHYALEIWYKTSLGGEELEAVGKRMKDRLEHVSSSGTIVDTGNIRIAVQTDVDRFPAGLSLWVSLIAPDEDTNTSLPGHLIAREGLTMSLYGPVVDYTSILAERVRRSRSKVPSGLPFVVAISSNRMLGSVARNVSEITRTFQPRKNTRISGVLLAEFSKAIGEGDVTLLRFIPNPYAVAPLTKAAQKVLSERTG